MNQKESQQVYMERREAKEEEGGKEDVMEAANLEGITVELGPCVGTRRGIDCLDEQTIEVFVQGACHQ